MRRVSGKPPGTRISCTASAWIRVHPRPIHCAALENTSPYLWKCVPRRRSKVKADVREPAIYGAVLALLPGIRLIVRLRGN